MSKIILNHYLEVKHPYHHSEEIEEVVEPESEVWYPPEDNGESIHELLRKSDLNNIKYDWRKTTKIGKLSNKNFSFFLFNIL